MRGRTLNYLCVVALMAACGSGGGDAEPEDGGVSFDAGVLDASVATDAAPVPDAEPRALEAIAALAGNLVSVDVDSGDTTVIAALNGDFEIAGLAYDISNKVIYALANFDDPVLLTIDRCTGNETVVGTMTATVGTLFFAEGLSFDSTTGTLYLAGSADGDIGGGDTSSESLFTVNTANGEVTKVATISGTLQDDVDRMGWVGAQGYVLDTDGTAVSHLYTLNTTTGTATSVGVFPTFEVSGAPADGSTLEHAFGTFRGQFVSLDLGPPAATAIGPVRPDNYGGLVLVDIECPAG